jgi:protein subunit release factor A
MIIEIRAAEGGEDARLLVEDQVTIYARVAVRRGL